MISFATDVVLVSRSLFSDGDCPKKTNEEVAERRALPLQLSLLCYFPNIMNIRNQEKKASW